jgi:hypothetical protein
MKLGDCEIGIRETNYGNFAIHNPDLFKPTTVHLGQTTFDTHFSAYECLGITALTGVLLMAAVAFVIARVSRRQDAV